MAPRDTTFYTCALSGIVACHMEPSKRAVITKSIRGLVRGNISPANMGTILMTTAGKDVVTKSVQWIQKKRYKLETDDALTKYMHCLGEKIVHVTMPKCKVCKAHCIYVDSKCSKDNCVCNKVVCCNDLCEECAEM